MPTLSTIRPTPTVWLAALLLGACGGVHAPAPPAATPAHTSASAAPAPSPVGSPVSTVIESRVAALPRPQLEHTGATALGIALRRVGPTQRVLMIGAHPDDENTAVLAELALRRGADVAYLSLTRGEGGQNLIGGELTEALGLIRTGELLAARRLDGAVQFFTRAYDFGFSKTAQESLAHWPRDAILGDVVRVMRAWRPDVVISVFSGTPRDGHGHHQVAGMMARAAFAAAADPLAYPELLRAGLPPHRSGSLYQALWRPQPGEATLVLETGSLDPLFGRSPFQIAMASRSRHRSQDMGRAQSIGPAPAALRLLESAAAVADQATRLFETPGLTLAGRAGTGPATALLRRYDELALELAAEFTPLTSDGALVDRLRRGLMLLDSAAARLPADRCDRRTGRLLESLRSGPGPGAPARLCCPR